MEIAFEIRAELGEGAFGTVYRVFNHTLQIEVFAEGLYAIEVEAQSRVTMP